jgi:hypothetical protein
MAVKKKRTRRRARVVPKRYIDPIYLVVEDSIARAKAAVERGRETVRSTRQTVGELQAIRAKLRAEKKNR